MAASRPPLTASGISNGGCRTSPYGGILRLLPIAAIAALSLTMILTLAYWLIVGVLSGFDAPNQQALSGLLTAAISTTALIGASLGAVYAFRKQILTEREGARADQQVYSDRYIKAAELLSNERAPSRLAAVHALANLADDWAQARSSCAAALVSYLRLPPPTSENGEEDAGEREVRRTIWKTIRLRMQGPGEPTSWHDQGLDFSGGRFSAVDLDLVRLRKTKVQFRSCSFKDGEIRLRGSHLAEGSFIDFTDSTFENMKVLLQGVRIGEESLISFNKVRFKNCQLIMDGMNIGGGCELNFRQAEALDSAFLFDSDGMEYWFQHQSSRIDGEVDFSESKLTRCRLPMHTYSLSGRLVMHEAVTDDFRMSVPGKLHGHPYVNLDLKPEGSSRISIGPGSIDGGDLRIRPRGGKECTLEVDFQDYDIAGGEVFIAARHTVWKSFRFDAACARRGRFKLYGTFPSSVEVEIDRWLEPRPDHDEDAGTSEDRESGIGPKEADAI
ncbi:hypothetical protein OG799_18705 [Micromonospora sp. NBC_00898]|uniref:hypothetical protein n=1 Tax=Micromonospora sp. NBC_00898 TaxID=2975981 RepID=UPI00386E08E4|nr:hypothetical protein OG799_18705 [Micromonospora sp. NBC_00898]